MRALLSVPAAFLVSVSVSSAAEPQPMPMDNWIYAIQVTVETQCKQYSAVQKVAAAKKDQETLRMLEISIGFACECMPKEITGYKSAMPEADKTKILSYEEFRASFSPAMNKCGAAQTRSQLSSLCEHDKSFSEGVADRKAYCKCFSSKLRAMDDDTLASAAEAAYASFQAKVKARTEGKPAPASSSKRSFLDEISESCRAPGR